MPYSIKLFLFLLVVIVANIMQTITGFAGTVLAMPFSILLIGSDLSRIILNVLGILASLGVVVLNRKSINWKEVLKICITMLVGMVGGYLILGLVDISKQVLLLILAGFVLLFTAIGCYTTFIKKEGLQEQPKVEENEEGQDHTTSEGPAVFSADWVKENLEVYKKVAWDNPTVENLRAYLTLQRFAIDRSEQFAYAGRMAVEGDPFLDEVSRNPMGGGMNKQKGYLLSSEQLLQFTAI